MKYNDEIIKAAKTLYLKKYSPKEIAKSLRLQNVRIVYYWAEKHKWALLLSEESIENAINRRLSLLIERENKSDVEMREIESLVNHHVKILNKKHKQALPVNIDEATTHETTSQRRSKKHNHKEKEKKGKKNYVSHLTQDDFDSVASELLYTHQQYVREHKKDARHRFILKSRQIGFTFYFAFEAFEDAVMTGQNQIFVSASKAQARIFSMYIKSIAQQYFDVEIGSGDIVSLSNNANLIFCANNVSTAQGYSGNVYFDEVFWMRDFVKLFTAAKAIATLKPFRTTLFSTPSTKDHPAYKMWSGESWKDGNEKRKNATFLDDKLYQMNGVICPDKYWRLSITLQNAIDLGFDKVDIDDLKESNSQHAFNMLYCCIFAASGKSVFAFEKLQKCITDDTSWQDFKIKEKRPFGNREVWGGFDPSRTRDNATFCVVAPPVHEHEKFRILELHTWKGLDFRHMASEIKKIKEKYHMTYIGVDITGIGYGVYEHIQDFARREVVAIHYNVNVKNQLVLKMLDVVENERIEWDEKHNTLLAAFVSIEQHTTAKSNQITYAATRSESTGHADEFFAVAHAVFNEPLNNVKKKSKWIMQK